MSSRAILSGIVGLAIGVAAGPWIANQLSTGNATKLGYCVDPLKVAETTVLTLRKQNKITVLEADIRATTTSIQRRWPVDAHKTLRATGSVGYQIDFNTVSPSDVAWNVETKTLTIKLGDPVASPPIIDLTRIIEDKDGLLVMWYTGAEKQLDAATRRNLQGAIWQRAKTDKLLLGQARNAARAAVVRDFGLPLQALGVTGAKIIVRFPVDRN